MKPSHIRIQELKKEIENLSAMKIEALAEHKEADDLQLHYRNKRDAADVRVNEFQDEIEYRLVEITELEEGMKIERATA
ncbi:hypothetical protein BRE01_49200 [Brevibacillus reuszeri]|uniref:Uncharacterized protein n=1 Tax=Brevibacillus reuszeri TaxID=54915 RepID=A0A0K9YLE9_9BACL|nr:hypothetical protein [Brevibacillus reuszeri]KNB69519.1 hypothetical protein ADS79_27015 [Brevibacillus reuszeri]MED1856117.1 hypothetical protein [Brevibacillus reuszeri]GED71218.1 hypothetical protein BRE01_49200 [Brevibacillus reuszeri]